MATYQFSALADGQQISFNPAVDILRFDQTAIAAADVLVAAVGANLRISVGSKDVLLTNVSSLQLATSNITFADGSRLLFGDNTTGTANDNAANSLVGTAGRDHLMGFGGADTLNGGAGNDVYIVGTGDVITDSSGVDTVISDVAWSLGTGLENLTLSGTGNISAQGNSLNNLLVGNSSGNYFNGRAGNDTILAGSGNDTIDMSTGGTPLQGNDSIDGGSGIDTVDYDGYALSAVVADLAAGQVTGGGNAGEGSASITSIERFVGGAFNDRIAGNSANNYLDGRGGNDTVDGGTGNDTLIGGTGSDSFLFSTAPDLANADQVTGFASGSDKLVLDGAAYAGIGDSGVFFAGDVRFSAHESGAAFDSNDRVLYNTSTGQLWYDADGNGSGAAQLIATLQGAPALAATDIEVINGTPSGRVIEGTSGNDSLAGTEGNDTIHGFAGDDSLDGREGSDRLIGGEGNDTLYSSSGTMNGDGAPDTLDGGLGDDLYRVSEGDVILADPGGIDSVFAERTDWTLGAGLENLAGANYGTGNDLDNSIIGHWEGGTIRGMEGADLLEVTTQDGHTGRAEGGEGNDTLIGSHGWNSLDGGAGDDFLYSRGSQDVLSGGTGADRFFVQGFMEVLRGAYIADFASIDDTIVLDGNRFASTGVSGAFVEGDARFWASADGVAHDASDRVIYNTSNGELWYDADGNGSGGAEVIATLAGAPALVATDLEVVNGTPPGQAITGTAGNDSLTGTEGNDSINGLGGNDTIKGVDGSDTLAGGDGNDFLEGQGGRTWNGLSGPDLLLGGAGDDTLYGASYWENSTEDTLDGGLGNDVYHIDQAGDVLIDAGGIDTLAVHAFYTWTLGDDFENLILYDGEGQSSITGIGNAKDNIINANYSKHAHLEGLGGNDLLLGAYSYDELFGGDGNDTLRGGGEGYDIDLLDGGQGDDLLEGSGYFDGGSGNDTLIGGIYFFDEFKYAVAPTVANADLISGFDSGVDRLLLDGQVFASIGGSGTFASDDDRFWAAAGAVSGHDADDRIVFDSASGRVYYDADGSGAGSAQLIATLQNGSLAASAITVVNGQSGTSQTGTTGNDSLVGGASNDTLLGLAGNDTLDGASGSDLQDGGAGHDLLFNGPGDDTLLGSEGDDTIATGQPHGGPFGQDSIDGGDGYDRLDFSGSNGPVNVFASVGVVDGPIAGDRATFTGIEEVSLTDFGDYVADGGTFVAIHGMGGNDTLHGGAGDEMVSGGDGDDYVSGQGGNDTLSGGSGNDTLSGGDGDDHLIGHSGDQFQENDSVRGGAGNDTVEGEGYLFGDAGDDVLDPGSSPIEPGDEDNVLTGGSGADRFIYDDEGGYGEGQARVTDFTTGGDTLVLDADDLITLGANGRWAAGDARFWASATGTAHDASDRIVYNTTTGELWYYSGGNQGNAWSLGVLEGAPALSATDIEVINGEESGQVINGTSGNDSLSGTFGNDTINGLGGNDTLVGGDGADLLDGGLGNDEYHVDGFDQIAGDAGGIDTAVTDGGWTLAPGIENLRAAGGGSGNELDNHMRIVGSSFASLEGLGGNDTLLGGDGGGYLIGGDGNDSIVGGASADALWGGTGTDTLAGGVGDDQYDASAGDVLIEAANGGIDTVGTDVSWTLGANFENLSLVGTASITANGNNLDNIIEGNDGNNSSINGRAGNDTMSGHNGNDVFDMSTGGTSSYGNDVIDGGNGTDSVEFGNNARSGVTVHLVLGTVNGGGDGGAGSATLTSIENALGGNFDDALVGNGGANYFRGSNGNDALWGGAGNDRLQGDAGNDSFVFEHLGTANADTVIGFAGGADRLLMENQVMTALGAAGNFSAGDARFWAAAGATVGHDANDRIVYNTSNGNLYYDADGSGGGAAQLIATLQGNPGLAAPDIFVT